MPDPQPTPTPAPSPPPQPQEPPGGTGQPMAAGPGSQDTTKAWVAYILTWLTGLIIFLVADKNDNYTRFHAIQAIGFGIAVVVVFIALSIVGGIMSVASAGAAAAMGLVNLALWVLVIVAIILMCVKAAKGEKFKLPIIGDIAEKNA